MECAVMHGTPTGMSLAHNMSSTQCSASLGACRGRARGMAPKIVPDTNVGTRNKRFQAWDIPRHSWDICFVCVRGVHKQVHGQNYSSNGTGLTRAWNHVHPASAACAVAPACLAPPPIPWNRIDANGRLGQAFTAVPCHVLGHACGQNLV